MTDVPLTDAQIALRQPQGVLFGGPYDGLTFNMTGFWSHLFALAGDVLVTPQRSVVPFWNQYDLVKPSTNVELHHYTLHEGKFYQYNYLGPWVWKDYHRGEA